MATPSTDLASRRVLLVGTADWIAELEAALERDTGATAVTATRADEAHRAVRERRFDCVVTGRETEDGSGIELLRAVREDHPTLPVILATADGSETLASRATAAAVTDYVPLGEPTARGVDEVVHRIGEAVRSAERTRVRRERAGQFDAMFHDSRRATWVLDADGAVRRANRTAAGMLDAAVEDVVGDCFWSLPCWPRPGESPSDVRRLVETALDGEFANAVVTRSTRDGDDEIVEFSAHPVTGEQGTVDSVVVETFDITQRVELERELRRSEELHRVTLNNMTDTVLITDESGAYTYVCPNVHFIFGYTVAEIRAVGTIDDLLGDDLFDREELAEEGVLKNIECTATDRAGREHTLLINVREVSIQNGTLLYSCRDITKRKQREEALATLQETAREFLYAETDQEIAQRVVDDVGGVLDLDACAVYLFEADANDLRPAAASTAMSELHGPVPAVHADGGDLVSYSFIEDETLFFDDVHDSDRLANRATEIRSAACIPLGDHGVFFAGSDDVGHFDEVARELADLLAATAEAALDRVERESRLREQDRKLQTRNSQLSALNRINGTIREIDQALVQAETREEIDHAVCERLTAADRFEFAWIGVVDPGTETVEPRAWAGDEQGYLDSLSFPVAESGCEPTGRTAATGETTMVTNVADRLRQESWRKDALARDFLSIISIPLVYNDLSYGVLTVYASSRNAFDETSQAVLAELGETVASATSAIGRKNALLTSSMTRATFEVDDPTFVLSRIASEASCTVTYEGGVQQTADGSYVFVTIQDGSLEAVEGTIADLVGVEDVRRISADGAEGVYRLTLAQPFVALELADHGAVLRSASVDPASASLVVDVPENVELRNVTQLVTDAFSDAVLVSKQSYDRSSSRPLHARVFDTLTDRQLEVIQTAYYSGFFESPRENSGEEIANALGISSSAFYQHVRAVQGKLFAVLLDDMGVPAPRAEMT